MTTPSTNPIKGAALILLFVAFIAGACSASEGLAGPEGPAGPEGLAGPEGPSIPVIQSIWATGLPAGPAAIVTLGVDVQSADDSPLTITWFIPEDDRWNFVGANDEPVIELRAPTTRDASNSSLASLATVVVTDARGRVATGSIALSTRGNTAPYIEKMSASPSYVHRGEPVHLSVDAIDPDGDRLSFEWSIPDGFEVIEGAGTSTLTMVSRRFVKGLAEVTVRDEDGAASFGNLTVGVIDGHWGSSRRVYNPLGDSVVGSSPVSNVALNRSGKGLMGISVMYRTDGGLDLEMATQAWHYDVEQDLWESRLVPGTETRYSSERPVVALNDTGHGLVAGLIRQDTGPRVYASLYDPATSGWQGATYLDEGNGQPLSVHAGLDGQGNALVAWLELTDASQALFLRRYDAAAGQWQPSLRLDDGSASPSAVDLAIDGNDNAFVVWRENLLDDASIMTRRYLATEDRWSTPTSLWTRGLDAPQDPSPKIAVDHAGNALVAWSHGDAIVHPDSEGTLLIARYDHQADTWNEMHAHETMAGVLSQPRLAINDGGDATLVWIQNFSSSRKLYGRRFNALSQSWTPKALLAMVDSEVSQSQVAMDAVGHALVAWRHGNRTHATRYHLETGWGAPMMIDFGAPDQQLALDANGTGIVLWGGLRFISALRFE